MVNTMKTFMLMAALTALFMLAGQALGGQGGMVFALVMALGMNFFAYWYSDRLALKMSRARELLKNWHAPLPFPSRRYMSCRGRPPLPLPPDATRTMQPLR